MERIAVNCISKWPHVSQVLCGFHMLASKEKQVEYGFRQMTGEAALIAAVEVIYKGKTIIYDLDDGYQHLEGMRDLLRGCDFYFKRSFSREKNEELLPEYLDKLYPLGFNYHVTYKGDPINTKMKLKHHMKSILGFRHQSQFTHDMFEAKNRRENRCCRVLFYARLWESRDDLPEAMNKEREAINMMRINIIRQLKKKYGTHFRGGVQRTELATRLCPELILPKHKTDRNRYLRLVHKSDICIGSMGLHESIGWKTGEYVAAGKAIVNEELRYSVPGNFSEGINYLAFTTAEECVAAVERLERDVAARKAMENRNREYYIEFLHPKALVQNTLDIVDKSIQ